VPRYFFNITHGKLSRLPDEGMELPNDEAAWEEATTTCGEMINELDGKPKSRPGMADGSNQGIRRGVVSPAVLR
jgi:hypothetical protein